MVTSYLGNRFLRFCSCALLPCVIIKSTLCHTYRKSVLKEISTSHGLEVAIANRIIFKYLLSIRENNSFLVLPVVTCLITSKQ